jgi:hypothetical protein
MINPFPLKENAMKPYSKTDMNKDQKIYNCRYLVLVASPKVHLRYWNYVTDSFRLTFIYHQTTLAWRRLQNYLRVQRDRKFINEGIRVNTGFILKLNGDHTTRK